MKAGMEGTLSEKVLVFLVTLKKYVFILITLFPYKNSFTLVNSWFTLIESLFTHVKS